MEAYKVLLMTITHCIVAFSFSIFYEKLLPAVPATL
jgi:hypothetical protein